MLAHPDDETFVVGGTLARYAAEGAAVHLLVATRSDGEAGVVRGEELACAARTLGLAGHAVLDYQESGMTWHPPGPSGAHLATAPIEEVAERVATEIRRVRPQVVLTFDATGAYGHPDHIAIGRATRLAFEGARREEDGPAKLYAAVFGRRWLALGVRALRLAPGRDPRRFGPRGDIDLAAALAEVEGAQRPTTFIDVRRHLAVRRRAALCHRSQLAGAPWPLRRWETLPPRLRGVLAPQEVFARLWPPPERGLRERDLWGRLP